MLARCDCRHHAVGLAILQVNRMYTPGAGAGHGDIYDNLSVPDDIFGTDELNKRNKYLEKLRDRVDSADWRAGAGQVYTEWRVEDAKEVCARMDLLDSVRGAIRLLATSLVGLAGISFVWCMIQLMQETASGGNVTGARNNAIRAIMGMVIFGSAWIIYEALTVSFFGTSSFTAGSFTGIGGTIEQDTRGRG